MTDLSKLFEQAGITAEEVVKYFLEPIYKDKNPSIENGVVFTDETDENGALVRTRIGEIDEIALQFSDQLMQFIGQRKRKKEMFLTWLAQNSLAAQGNSSKSLLGNLVDGLKGIFESVGKALNSILPRKENKDGSGVGEGRILSEEQGAVIKKATQKLTHGVMATQSRSAEDTKKLAQELNILDAVYDNIAVIKEVQREAENMAKDQKMSVQEQQAAQALSQALRNPNQVAMIATTRDNNIVVQNRTNDPQRRSNNIIRSTGRMAAIRERIAQAAAAAEASKSNSFEKAMREAGRVSVGSGGRDANKIEKSKTPNDPGKQINKGKELT